VNVVAEGAFLSGRMEGVDIEVAGCFEGTLIITGRLLIKSGAKVKADVHASHVRLEGEFEGQIEAGELAFGDCARARGLFRAGKISMPEGAVVDGGLNLPVGEDQPKASPGQ